MYRIAYMGLQVHVHCTHMHVHVATCTCTPMDQFFKFQYTIQTDGYKLTATPETESSTGPPFPVTFPLTSGGGAATSDSGEGMQSDETSHTSLRVRVIVVYMYVHIESTVNALVIHLHPVYTCTCTCTCMYGAILTTNDAKLQTKRRAYITSVYTHDICLAVCHMQRQESGPYSSEEMTHSGLGVVQEAQPTSMVWRIVFVHMYKVHYNTCTYGLCPRLLTNTGNTPEGVHRIHV